MRFEEDLAVSDPRGSTTFSARALSILRSRAGLYEDISAPTDPSAVERLRITAPGDAVIVVERSWDPRPLPSLRAPLPLRSGSIDAVRCATFVFGVGNPEADEDSEELWMTFRPNGRIGCAYGRGAPGDPFDVVWQAFVTPVPDQRTGDDTPSPGSLALVIGHDRSQLAIRPLAPSRTLVDAGAGPARQRRA